MRIPNSKHLALPSAGFFPSSGSQSVITAKGAYLSLQLI